MPAIDLAALLDDKEENLRPQQINVMQASVMEATQVRQRCLDMRVLDGDLVVPTCLQTPTLILPTGHFMQLYFNPDRQGQYASQFLEDG